MVRKRFKATAVETLEVGKNYYVSPFDDSYGELVEFDEEGDPCFNMIDNEGGYGINDEGLAPFFKIPLHSFWSKED